MQLHTTTHQKRIRTQASYSAPSSTHAVVFTREMRDLLAQWQRLLRKRHSISLRLVQRCFQSLGARMGLRYFIQQSRDERDAVDPQRLHTIWAVCQHLLIERQLHKEWFLRWHGNNSVLFHEKLTSW